MKRVALTIFFRKIGHESSSSLLLITTHRYNWKYNKMTTK